MRRTAARLTLAALGLALACAALPPAADGHGRSLSWSSWRLSADGAWIRVRVPLLELTRTGIDPIGDPRATATVATRLAAQVRLTPDGRPSEPVADPLPAPASLSARPA